VCLLVFRESGGGGQNLRLFGRCSKKVIFSVVTSDTPTKDE
jgi:hypothetical protein